MHRAFDRSESPFTGSPFTGRSSTSLYLFTALVGGLLLADVLPLLSDWLTSQGWNPGLPTWPRTVYGIRFALIAAVLGTARHLFAALEYIGNGKIGSDLAVAIAGLAAILIDEPLVAAEVVVIALVGECLEAITFDRTQNALRSLGELFPVRCWVLRDGKEVRAFTTELAVGDAVVVKPGGKIPVDGPVTAGQSSVNTAALTGESLPREVGVGDRVLAGSLNELGTLTVTAEKVATQTVAGRVIALTESALKEKAPLERTADRLAAKFLPAVLALAAVAFLVHFFVQRATPVDGRALTVAAAARIAVYPALGVLVVACPCPLVLATPAAVVAALGRLAGTGVLVKGGAALERLASVTAVAFDKTGTITEGSLSLGEVIPFGMSAEEVMTWAAAAEAGSEHPLAKAVLAAAKAKGLPVPKASEFTAHPGGGVAAKVDERAVIVGTKRFLTTQSVATDDAVETALTTLDGLGQTPLLVAVDGRVIGAIGAKDTVRPEAAGVLAELKELGLSPLVLLTGDRPAAANAITAQLTLDAVHAGLLPGEKADKLPPNAAFVGDGINDAPALAKATVGIAVAGGGADVAAEAGDVVLMGGTLRPLPLLVRLSRETAKVIRQNIVWFGFGVNFVGVLLTGFLWPLLSPNAQWYVQAPLVGVLYHQLGSLLVLLNSMRLLGFERTSTSPLAVATRTRFRDFDRWMNTIHLDDAVHEIGHRWKQIAFAVVILGLVGWFATGLTAVGPGEVGVVTRFGAFHADLTPGLHVRYPAGIERTTIIRINEARSVELGFRTLSAEKQAILRDAKAVQEAIKKGPNPGEAGWAAGHAEGVARLTDESLMLTGDGNMVEVLATVRYSVADARAFLNGPADPSPAIRSTAEAVLREQAAAGRAVDLLTSDRPAFEAAAKARLTERLKSLLPGIKLDGVTVHDLHPPAEVVAAYHAVAEAIQTRDRFVNESQGDAIRMKKRAEEQAVAIVRGAEAEAHRRVAEAGATRDAFLSWHAARVTLSPDEEKQVAAERDGAALRQRFVNGRKWLTEFRLTLAATTAALSGRDKVIIDSETIPGRRTIYLMDPEAFRPAVAPVKSPDQ